MMKRLLPVTLFLVILVFGRCQSSPKKEPEIFLDNVLCETLDGVQLREIVSVLDERHFTKDALLAYITSMIDIRAPGEVHWVLASERGFIVNWRRRMSAKETGTLPMPLSGKLAYFDKFNDSAVLEFTDYSTGQTKREVLRGDDPFRWRHPELGEIEVIFHRVKGRLMPLMSPPRGGRPVGCEDASRRMAVLVENLDPANPSELRPIADFYESRLMNTYHFYLSFASSVEDAVRDGRRFLPLLERLDLKVGWPAPEGWSCRYYRAGEKKDLNCVLLPQVE